MDQMGFVTLYRNKEQRDFPEGEYYQPTTESTTVNGVVQYFVSEKHAYFNNIEKVMKNEVTTFSPEEGYATQKEANERFEQQVQYRAKTGFVHCFYFDPLKDDGIGYRLLTVK